MVWRHLATKWHARRSISNLRHSGGPLSRRERHHKSVQPSSKSPSAEGGGLVPGDRRSSSRWNNGREAPEPCSGSTTSSSSSSRSSRSQTAPAASHTTAGALHLAADDEASLNALILHHSKNGQPRHALRIYDAMAARGAPSSSYTFVAALKACSSAQDLERGKQVHADAARAGLARDVFVGTALVDLYVKCGSVDAARRVFESAERNVVSWNAMVMGYAQAGQGGEALRLYKRMRAEGVVPNDRTFVAALKACAACLPAAAAAGGALAAVGEDEKDGMGVKKKMCLEQVQGVHADVVAGQAESDIYVGSLLVDVYAKCGSVVEARRVFDAMPRRNVVSWTAMVLGYAQVGDGEEALRLYERMRAEGVAPNDRTFIAALKACGALAVAKEAGAAAASNSGGSGGGCGADAGHQQQQMSRRALEYVRSIHRDVVKTSSRCGGGGGGGELAVFVGSTLVDVYVKCGSLADARGVFDQIPRAQRDVAAWNTMILGYSHLAPEQGGSEEALALYAQMQQDGVMPDGRTFLGALKACCNLAASEEWTTTTPAAASLAQDGTTTTTRVKQRALDQVRAIHAAIRASSGAAGGATAEDAATSDVFVGSTLVDVYAKSGALADARRVFDNMAHRNVVAWTAMILGYAQADGGGGGPEALRLFARMREEGGVQPNELTYVGALKACGSVADLDTGKRIHADLSSSSTTTTSAAATVATALVEMYARCGSMPDAQQALDALPPPARTSTPPWNALIAGYARQGAATCAFRCFRDMRAAGAPPDGLTVLGLLHACSHAGLVDAGAALFDSLARGDFPGAAAPPAPEHYSCMVDMLCRAGHFAAALRVVDAMPAPPGPGPQVWRAVLGACQKWGGQVPLAQRAFEAAVRLDTADSAAYVLMANVYAAAGLLEQAQEVKAMRVRAGAFKQPGQTWCSGVGVGGDVFRQGGAGRGSVAVSGGGGGRRRGGGDSACAVTELARINAQINASMQFCTSSA